MNSFSPGTLTAIAYEGVALWSTPDPSDGDQARIANLDKGELLLVITIVKFGTSRDALVVSPLNRSVGYVNVMSLNEVML